MPALPEPDGISIGELSRQVQGVLVRFESLVTRLDGQYVRNENLELYKQLVNQTLQQLQTTVAQLASAEKVKDLEADIEAKASKGTVAALESAVKELQDDKKWLTRLILGFIILAVLGAIFAAAQIGGGGVR
jgi:uncharacterized membrane protein YheB (UPF0754 family)